MTKLIRAALTHVPLTYETVESFYDGMRTDTAEQCLKALCESHERLRDLLARVVERDEPECRLDHNGFCQEHCYGSPCPIPEAKKAIGGAA